MKNGVTSDSFLTIEEIAHPLYLVTFAKGMKMDQAKVNETRQIYEGLSQQGKIRLIIDLNGLKQVDRDARRSMCDKHTEENIEAMAILVGDPISRMIGNFLIGINKPKMPVKLFSDIDSAKNWFQT